MAIDKKRLRDLIERYQELNEDVDDSWLNSKILKFHWMTDEAYEKRFRHREEFKVKKMKWYEAKRKRLKNETEEERNKRLAEKEVIENELFSTLYDIIDYVTRNFGLQAIRADEYFFDLKQSIILRLIAVVNRFDTDLPNPLSYFIAVIKNYAYNERADEFKYRCRFLTHTFLETHDIGSEEDESTEKDDKPDVWNNPVPKSPTEKLIPSSGFDEFMIWNEEED